jgi:tetratricopeptide (TPR) repeat protein
VSEITAARDALAAAYLRTGDYDAVDRITEHALETARANGDRRLEGDALALQGMTLHFRAIELPPDERAAIDHGPEQRLFEQALARRRESDDEEGIAESLWQLGLVHQVLRRDNEAGAPLFRDALERAEPLPGCDPWLRSEIHRHVGFDHMLREEHDQALHHLRVSLELREALAEQGWITGGLTALSTASLRAGRRDDAVDYARRAVELVEAEGLRERHVTAAADALAAACDT